MVGESPYYAMTMLGKVICTFVMLIKQAGILLFYLLIIRAILSWVSQGRNPFESVLIQLTEPFIAPIRRIVPPMGGMDWSVLVLFIVLNVINKILPDIVPFWGQI